MFAISGLSPTRTRLLMGIAVVLIVGCQRGPAKGLVKGSVTLDGKPLDAGIVRFVPIDGKGAASTAPVAEGAFQLDVEIGPKKVEFSAPKVMGTYKVYDTPESPTANNVEELLPTRYNVATELTLEVKKGEQAASFELKLQP